MDQNNNTKDDNDDPLPRALELGSALIENIVTPVATSLLLQGWPDDPNEFWARRTATATTRMNGESSSSSRSNAERVAAALEVMGPVYVKFGVSCC